MPAKRVYGPAQLSNVSAILYTVPAAMRFVMRHVRISNPTAGAVDVTFGIGADAAGTRIYDGFPVPADSYEDFYPYAAVEAAEVIRGHASALTSLVIVIEGDLEAI